MIFARCHLSLWGYLLNKGNMGDINRVSGSLSFLIQFRDFNTTFKVFHN